MEQQESTLNYQLESLKEVHPPVLDRERILFLLEQFLISPNERTEDYNRRIIDTFVNRIEITDTEMLIYFNLSEASASEKQKFPAEQLFDWESSGHLTHSHSNNFSLYATPNSFYILLSNLTFSRT